MRVVLLIACGVVIGNWISNIGKMKPETAQTVADVMVETVALPFRLIGWACRAVMSICEAIDRPRLINNWGPYLYYGAVFLVEFGMVVACCVSLQSARNDAIVQPLCTLATIPLIGLTCIAYKRYGHRRANNDQTTADPVSDWS